MEKKLRITVPNEIYKIIESDLEDFRITKNFLCNYIFENSKGFKQIYNYKYNGSKKIIQFNLNKKNLENYYSFLAEKKIEVEAEYFRNIFFYYAQQSKKSRELFIFKNITEKKVYEGENDFVREVIENFDPFLSYSRRVKVKFTDEGLEILKKIKTYRPKLLKQEGNICVFQCSELQGKRYFSVFWNEAEILEPLELRNWFRERSLKMTEIYK